MKVKMTSGVHIHLGTPWKGGALTFKNPMARNWDVVRLWGLSISRWPYCFVGVMRLSPSTPPRDDV